MNVDAPSLEMLRMIRRGQPKATYLELFPAADVIKQKKREGRNKKKEKKSMKHLDK
jgi:hypothetical protein